MRGSDADEPDDVAARLTSAQRTLGEAHATLATVTAHIVNYLTILGVTATGHAAPSSTTTIESLRARLPPPVVPGSGQKTHGRWIGPDGTVHSIVSGHDVESAAAWDLLKERGLPTRTMPWTVTHVEQKLAAHMVREKITHATILINNKPCADRLGCEALLPLLLPVGYSLTVHGPNYLRTFIGRAVPRCR